MSNDTHTVPADRPLATRLAGAVFYPLRGAALVALITLPLAHAVADLLPGVLGWAAGVLIWVSIILYAMECLRRTADGYADPPEVTLYSNSGPALSLMLLQVLEFIALVLADHGQPLLWLLVLGLVLLLPAMAMALAFEDNMLAALHPGRWSRALLGFGSAYLLPVALGILENLIYISYIRSTGWLESTLLFVPVVYLCLLQFQLKVR